MSKTEVPRPHQLPSQHAISAKRRRPWLRGALAGLLSVALFVGTSGALVLANINNQVRGAVIATSGLGAAGQSGDQPVDSFEGRAVNILIAGLDSRYGDNGSVGAGTAATVSDIRSDTTMILHLSADRSTATVLSIPRDLMTTIPSCVRSDGTSTYETWDMFNSAFALGAVTDDIAGGIACTQAAAETLTGIDIDGFVVVDFAGFEKLIDALGGVEICLDEAIYDTGGYTNLNLPEGCQTLNGVQGLAYARARHVNTSDGSDLQRIDRQQKLVGAIVNQALASNMFTDLPMLYALLQEALKIVGFSESLQSLSNDAGLLNSVRNVNRSDFRFVTLPWVTDPDNANRVIASEPLASELFTALAGDQPLPVGVNFRDLDNHKYIVGDDGTAIMVDDEGNHVMLDSSGKAVPSPGASADDTATDDTAGTD